MSSLTRLLFPTQNACHLCGRALTPDSANGLCLACTQALLKLRLAPALQRAEHPPLAVCLSAFSHAGAARSLVHRLKFAGDPVAAQALAEGMTAVLAHSGLLAQAEAVLPVPISAGRLRERGYNQAEVLAREVCAHTGLVFLPNALTRTAENRTQITRTRAQRLSAMRGAFQASADPVQGKTLLLIDDVLTTGATGIACAETLLAAGAKAVYLLTACRA